jgi:hypothetical protein
MFGMGKSTDFSRCGVGFNLGRAFGITAYNNTNGKLQLGDVVALKCTGTTGQEWVAIDPETNAIAGWVGVVADLQIEAGAIGKIFLEGKVQARVIGHASLAKNVFLEAIIHTSFDGTETNLAFVAGSGSTRDTITDSDTGMATDGFLAGDRVTIYGSTSNDGVYEIYSIAEGTMTLTSIGALTSETGASGMTMVAHGKFKYDGAADTANSAAVAREAYVTTTQVATKWVQLQGVQKVVAAS